MEKNKKHYIKPEMCILEMEQENLMAASAGNPTINDEVGHGQYAPRPRSLPSYDVWGDADESEASGGEWGD